MQKQSIGTPVLPGDPDPANLPAARRLKRPCIGVCRYDETIGWCAGCGMTKREKKAWKREPAFQPTIASALPMRLEALRTAGRLTGAAAKKR